MLPLSGLRVIAIEQYGAGPFGSMMLADLGAEVIKVENPAEGGDVSRSVGPHFFGNGDSHFFQSFNRNKKSLTLNLKHPQAARVLHALVRTADATFDNLRGDQPGRLGITYAQLERFNPRIVCTHLSAYGREGSRKAWPGYDYLMQAEAGYLALTGEPDGPPSRMGLSIVDLMAGLNAAFALVSGVLSARATGKGRDIDVDLFDTALQNLCYLAVWYLNAGVNQGREPRSSHPSLTPSQLYRTRDGFIFIMCNKEKFWPELCRCIGRPEWSTRPESRTSRRALPTAPSSPRTLMPCCRPALRPSGSRFSAAVFLPRASTICAGRWKTRSSWRGAVSARSITLPAPSASSPPRSSARAKTPRAWPRRRWGRTPMRSSATRGLQAPKSTSSAGLARCDDRARARNGMCRRGAWPGQAVHPGPRAQTAPTLRPC